MDSHPMNLGPVSPLILESLPNCRVSDYAIVDPHLGYRETWEGNQYGSHGNGIAVHELAHHGMLYGHNFSREYLTSQAHHDSPPFNFAVSPTPVDGQAQQHSSHFAQQRGSPPNSQVPVSSGGDKGVDPMSNTPAGTPHTIPRLSALITEVNETCAMLKDSPWAHINNLARMSDYPIGRILHLSQEFIDILRGMGQSPSTRSGPELGPAAVPNHLGKHSFGSHISPHGLVSPISIGSGIGHPADIPEARLQNQTASMTRPSQSAVGTDLFDAPAMLLALSCFISLTKLYGIVFTHFEGHLSGLPPTSLSSTPVDIGLIQSRGLQLGELPLLDETFSKTYTGLRMLLDTFQCAEDAIGLPSSLSIIRGSALHCTEGDMPVPRSELKDASSWTALQGELMLAVLKHDTMVGGSSVQEGFYDLSIKIQSLKRILRDNMFL